MQNKLGKQARSEVLAVLRERYHSASKEAKGKILDEFVAVAGCHRKHAVRLLTRTGLSKRDGSIAVRRLYNDAVREALIVLWEAADRICGKRLKAILPGLVAALEQHGHLALDPAIRTRLLAASAATIDRLLASVRGKASPRKKRKTGTRPSKQIAVRTFADWKEPAPGYLEIDFVSHGGTSMEGAFLWSLAATDVCTGWVEVVPLLAREQSLVVEGLELIRRQLPVPVRGIDTDNDGAFINDTLLAYCQAQQLEFTRSRAYQKNDQAWIEQKNGAVVRRFVGYERLVGLVAGQCLAQLFQAVRLYVNYFQPSFKLRSKTRQGAKVKKCYEPPATPCERLLAQASVAEATKEKLRAQRTQLDPLELLRRIRESQAALAALATGELDHGPERANLEHFLAALPELWRQGDARPTHRAASPKPREYRTRVDPFEGAWPEILLWLQENPEATAKALLERLQQKYPGRFPEGQLRTLQRRIREWRRVMARKLIYGCQEGAGIESSHEAVVVGAAKSSEEVAQGRSEGSGSERIG